MVDKTGLWLPRLGVLQIENLSTAGNFKLKGNLILWNKTLKMRFLRENEGVTEIYLAKVFSVQKNIKAVIA